MPGLVPPHTHRWEDIEWPSRRSRRQSIRDAEAADAEHVAAADPHTGYRLESEDHSHESSGAQGGKIDHDAALNNVSKDDHHNEDHAARHLAGGGDTLIGTFREDISFSDYIETNARTNEHHMHGEIAPLTTTESIDSGGGFSVSPGISRVMLVVLAGSDLAGDITLTGTTVDRDTGAETASDTEVLAINGLTTDGSDTDAAGNVRESFTKAYITTKWFRGSVALTTSDVTLTDVDVYSITFDQFDGEPIVSLDAFDVTFSIVTGAADFFAYLYTVVDTGTNTYDITRVASVGDVSANLAVGDFRLRRGSLAVSLDGTTDGIFVTMFPGTNNRFEDTTVKIWARFIRTIVLSV